MGVIHTLEFLDDEGVNADHYLPGTVSSVLSLIQNDVSEYLREPWPSTNTRDMAMPDARLDASGLHLWFGATEHSAVVSLPTIPLDELGSL
jgi:hypothetical protein